MIYAAKERAFDQCLRDVRYVRTSNSVHCLTGGELLPMYLHYKSVKKPVLEQKKLYLR